MNNNKYSNIYFKNKLIKIINQKGGDDIEVTIDDKIFKLIAKQDKGAGDRSHLIIESRDLDGSNKLVFLCYRSNSEVGIWRFLCWHMNYYKGDDYVTNTFIDIRLQKFIYENYHLIPNLVIHEENKKKIGENTNIGFLGQNEYMFNQSDHYLVSDSYRSFVTDILNSKNLHLTIPQKNNIIITENLEKTVMVDKEYDEFKILNLLGQCGTYWPNYVELWDNYESIRDILKNTLPNFEVEVEKNRAQINNARPSLVEGGPPKFSYSYFDLIKDIDGYSFRDHDAEFCASLSIISKYLETIMTVDTSTLKFEYAFNKTNDPNKFIFNIYTVEVKINGRDYLMYCAKYTTNFVSRNPFFNEKNKEYKVILNLIPKDSKITSIGLHSKYLSLGVYLCKILEYTNQSLFNDVHRILIGSSYYNFAGHFYDKLYPLNLIPFGDMIIPEDKADTAETFTAGDKYLDKILTYNDFLYCKKMTDLPQGLKECMDIIGTNKINIESLQALETIRTNSYDGKRNFDVKLKNFMKGNYLHIVSKLDTRIAALDGDEKEAQVQIKAYLENLDYFQFILGLEFQLRNNGYEINNHILNIIFENYIVSYHRKLSQLQLTDPPSVSRSSSSESV